MVLLVIVPLQILPYQGLLSYPLLDELTSAKILTVTGLMKIEVRFNKKMTKTT